MVDHQQFQSINIESMYALLQAPLNIARIFFLFVLSGILYPFLRSKSFYFFLRFSGPTFIKVGQLLSTRSDIIGDDLALSLSSFQDNLKPFSFKKAKFTVETELNKKINQIFTDFSVTAIASASIAQVHKAKLLNGDIVAVKILRPNISKTMARDISTLQLISIVIGLFSVYIKEKINDIISLLEDCYKRELDLMWEASAASNLKEQLVDVAGFYVPKIYWNLTTSKILVLEWVDGIPFSNVQKIRDSKFDKKEIAKNLVISYFNQVYVHGFFHADMHPGNLFLMPNGNIAVVDFGIIGIIDRKTRIAIAEILMAFLKKNYTKVAKLHIEVGLVPKNVNIEEFALTCRAIGETVVNVPVREVSLAKLLGLLLKMTKKYNMKTKPELLLLQKTMMLLEGVGVELDRNLNIWELASPWMEKWAYKNISFDAKIVDQVLLLFDAVKKFSTANDNQQQSEDSELVKKIEKLTKTERRWKIAVIISITIFLLSILIGN